MTDTQNQKRLKEILLEGLTDIIGFDKGYYRTLIDLVRRPATVITAYHQNENRYTRPMAFMLVSAGFYITVANYLIDWGDFMRSIISFVEKYLPSEDLSKTPEELARAQAEAALVMEDLFSKYWVAFSFVVCFVRAAGFVKITPLATYPQMVVIMLYRYGGSLLISTLFMFPLLFKNDYVLLVYFLGMTVLDQYIFRNYINEILGPGSRKSFTKRMWILMFVVIIVAILIGVIGEWLD